MIKQKAANLRLTKYFLLVLLATHAEKSRSSSFEKYVVPSFSLEELTTGKSDATLRDVLSTTGILAVRVPSDGIDGNIRALCECDLGPHVPGGDRFLLSNNVERSTVATATKGTKDRLELPRREIKMSCNDGADVYERMEDARTVVSRAASGAFLPALDRLIIKNNESYKQDSVILQSSDGVVYHTVTNVVEDATNLEHFHVYSRNKSESEGEEDSATALDWHRDAGVLLAFLPGQMCDGNDRLVDSSLHVKVPSSNDHDAFLIDKVASFPESNENEIVVAIMLGVGAEHWLKFSDDSDFKLRATQHAVTMRGGERRVWYGMMHLVPTQAIVQTSPTKRTFSEMRSSAVADGFEGETSSSLSDVSIGCGDDAFVDNAISDATGSGRAHRPNVVSHRRRRRVSDNSGHQHQDVSDCDNQTNFYCWLKCSASGIVPENKELSTQEHLDSGRLVYCVDKGVLDDTNDVQGAVDACTSEADVVGGKVNMNCTNLWLSVSDGTFSYANTSSGGGGGGGDSNKSSGSGGPNASFFLLTSMLLFSITIAL